MSTWNPSDYSRNSGQQQKWAKELIGKLQLRGDERVLDIGCGDGKVTAELAAQVPRGSVVGLDSSRDMVGFAAASFPAAAHANLSFVQGDAARLDLHERFDLVFSNATLHWIYDHQPVLMGIFRALKPSGRILVQMGGKGCAADVMAVLEPMLSEPRWRAYFEHFGFRYGFHGPEEYRQWLVKAGLTPVRVDLIPKDMVHPGREGLIGWLRTTWLPYADAVPEQQRNSEFLGELADGYIKQHPADAHGNVHVRMVRLEVEAFRPAIGL